MASPYELVRVRLEDGTQVSMTRAAAEQAEVDGFTAEVLDDKPATDVLGNALPPKPYTGKDGNAPAKDATANAAETETETEKAADAPARNSAADKKAATAAAKK